MPLRPTWRSGGTTVALRSAAAYASSGSKPPIPFSQASAKATSELVPTIRSA
ncbi:hypothetical protein D3C72_2462380 [compost metagenome]